MIEFAIGAGALFVGVCLPNLALGVYAGARKFRSLMRLESVKFKAQIKMIRSTG